MTDLDEPRLASLELNYRQLANRLRVLEDLQDVWDTPWWKLGLFVIDGWPLRRIVDQPQWRPWRRWFRS